MNDRQSWVLHWEAAGPAYREQYAEVAAELEYAYRNGFCAGEVRPNDSATIDRQAEEIDVLQSEIEALTLQRDQAVAEARRVEGHWSGRLSPKSEEVASLQSEVSQLREALSDQRHAHLMMDITYKSSGMTRSERRCSPDCARCKLNDALLGAGK
jgi:chromosome segregation ATPase